MSKEDNEALTIGTTAVALHFKGGAVIAAHRRGTVDSDTVFYGFYGEENEVPMNLGMLGTTRASILAGSSGKNLRLIRDATLDRLVKAEKSEELLDTVEESANYLCKQYGKVRGPMHLEMIVAGWDNMKKEGAPRIWYSNDMFAFNVELNKATGPGRYFAQIILARHDIGMSEKEAVDLAEQAVLEAARGYRKKGGSLDVWVIKDGQIIKNKTQLMTDVAEKFGVPI
ncbi:hypothetical protein MKW92_027870 [Papaver armeniacum]|nr:hypothetical protein MKW92_027870 [Papaver armeniacum]